MKERNEAGIKGGGMRDEKSGEKENMKETRNKGRRDEEGEEWREGNMKEDGIIKGGGMRRRRRRRIRRRRHKGRREEGGGEGKRHLNIDPTVHRFQFRLNFRTV